MGFSVKELLLLAGIIILLSATGFWPKVIRGLRELRGDYVEPQTPTTHDMEICFKLLGISPSSSWADIERAYRQKAKVHHPDLGGDEDAMRALNEAYTALKQLKGK